jgi:hypothetical protein
MSSAEESDKKNRSRTDKFSMVVLTKNNYIQWKESFENLSMSYGDAGNLWRNKVELQIMRPEITDADYLNIDKDLARQMFMRDYDSYKKRMERYKTSKQTLCGLMMQSLSMDLNERIRGDKKFGDLWKNYNVSELADLIEVHATGKSSTSIFVESAKMIKLEQGNDTFSKYAKTFKDTVTSLRAKGTADEILNSIIDSKFILGVNQVAFKDQLSIIFSSEKWPPLQETIDIFSRYANTKESVETLNNNEVGNGT